MTRHTNSKRALLLAIKRIRSALIRVLQLRARLFSGLNNSLLLQTIRDLTQDVRKRSSILYRNRHQRRIRTLRGRTSTIATRPMAIHFNRVLPVIRRPTFNKHNRPQGRQRRHNLTHTKQTNSKRRKAHTRVMIFVGRRAFTTFKVQMKCIFRLRNQFNNKFSSNHDVNFSYDVRGSIP